MKLIVTVPELECGALDNATWDDQPYKHDNDDVRYKPRYPVCHLTRAGLNRLLVVRWSNTAGMPRVIVLTGPLEPTNDQLPMSVAL